MHIGSLEFHMMIFCFRFVLKAFDTFMDVSVPLLRHVQQWREGGPLCCSLGETLC